MHVKILKSLLPCPYNAKMIYFHLRSKGSHWNCMSCKLGQEVDEVSMDLAPGDLTGNIKFPIKIIGDGNCLPRCGSMLAFKNEDHHLEIRVRIVLELALNETVYMNNDYLRRGIIGKGQITNSYAMYRDQCTGCSLD